MLFALAVVFATDCAFDRQPAANRDDMIRPGARRSISVDCNVGFSISRDSFFS